MDTIIYVQGEDWDGNPTQRALRPGWSLALRGESGKGFDIRGPHATMCGECGSPLFVDGGHTSAVLQRHLSEEHTIDVAMMR